MTNNPYPVRTADDILKRIPEKFPWLWEGFLRPGALTLFASPSRIGKSTLMAMLLDRMAKGGTLAGRPVKPGKVFVASEEEDTEWAPRIRALNLAGHCQWSMCPFPLSPTRQQWWDYVKMMASHEADLYVLDSLQHFLPPYAENSTAGIRSTIPVLKMLQKKWASVWTLHHPNKDDPAEFSFRGDVSLQASVDIMMELRMPAGASPLDRRRLLHVKSRYDLKPRVMIELDAAGKEYTILAEQLPEDAFEVGWIVLKIVLEDAAFRLTATEVWDRWPQDYDKPSLRHLRRWLQRAAEEQLVERTGQGRRECPYRYALPGRKFDPTALPPLPDPAAEDRERYG